MKIEELLSARYEVIADYPRSLYKVGDIIHESENLEGKTFFKTEVQKYPHIFKKIDWFKDRIESEMPQYLKFVWNDKTDDVRRVEKWLYADEAESWKPIKERKLPHVINGFTHESSYEKGLFPRVSLSGWLPATEKEYNDFYKEEWDYTHDFSRLKVGMILHKSTGSEIVIDEIKKDDAGRKCYYSAGVCMVIHYNSPHNMLTKQPHYAYEKKLIKK